jgi:hypothetical protein
MPEGKYFMLVSKLSGCAFGPEGGSAAPGVRLVTVARNDNDDKLYWYADPLTGTIRNKVSGLCLSVQGDCNLVQSAVEAGNPKQSWILEKNVVKNRTDQRVLDITGNNPNVGVPICAWAPHGGGNQQWDVVFQRPKYFVLVGEASGKAIDICGANRSPGAKICIYDRNNNDNQLWYEDHMGLVRSKLNDFVFDNSGDDIVMQPFEPNNPRRAWVVQGNAIAQLAKPSQVLDVRKESCENGATICSYDNRGASNQKWAVQYV